MIFFWDNYADVDILANYEFSSEQTSFPGENLLNSSRRSKVWRSNGYWNITASNNVIIFRDVVAGADKTATVAIAEYNSTASLLIAIDTAMEAVGANDYTITYNAQSKFVFTSSGAQFELRTANAGFTMASLLGFDTAIHRTGSTTYTGDELRIHGGTEWFVFDMGISSFVNSVVMVDERNRPIRLSPSSMVKIQGNPTDPIDWSTAQFESTFTYDAEVLMKFEPLDGNFFPSALRYWRIQFNDQNVQGFIQMGAIFMGRYFKPSRCPSFPFTNSFDDRSVTVFSEGGQSFADILPQTEGFIVQYKNLTFTDTELIRYYFQLYGVNKSFFVSMDSNEVFSSGIERMTRFVKFSSEPTFSLDRANSFSCSMNLREEL